MSESKTRKNDIFTTNPGQSGVQMRNVMKDDFDWEVPVERIPLPSQGTIYGKDSNLYGKEFLEIKAMTAREEDILTSRALIQQGVVMTRLIESCIIDKNISVDNLITGDRNALMVSVRITGYGTAYNSSVDCPECGENTKEAFDLSQLEIKRLDIEPVSPGENLFEFTLPVTKKVVKFKFLTGKDERERSVSEERRTKIFGKNPVESNVTSRLEQSIVAIDDVEDRNKIKSFISNMPALDSRRLRTYMDKNEPGIDMRVWLECKSCGEHSKVGLPIGTEFFWPRE